MNEKSIRRVSIWKAKGKAEFARKLSSETTFKQAPRGVDPQISALIVQSKKYARLRQFIVELMDPNQLADLGQKTPDAQKVLEQIWIMVGKLDHEETPPR